MAMVYPDRVRTRFTVATTVVDARNQVMAGMIGDEDGYLVNDSLTELEKLIDLLKDTGSRFNIYAEGRRCGSGKCESSPMPAIATAAPIPVIARCTT